MRSCFIKALLRLCAILPLPLTHVLGAFIGWMLVLIPNESRRVADINVRRCFPGWDEARHRRLVRRSLIDMGKTMTEAGALWLRGERAMAWVRQVSGESYIKEAMAAGKGMILAVTHLGAWEMIGLYASKHYPITSLYQPPKIESLDALLRAGRERLGATLVPTDIRGVRALYEALGRGEMVGILPDQEPAAGSGVFAPMFGIQAYTMVLVSRMALKTKAPVIFAYAERLPWGRGYHVHFIPAPSSINEGTLESSVAVMNQTVEQCVCSLPEQYQWGYKRFRIRPEGEVGIY